MNTAVKSASENASGITRSSLVGCAMSGLVIAFCLMDGTMKLFHPQVVVDATMGIGWPADPATLDILGVILLACTALYAFPRTAALGAILLTGYLGGAVASHAASETRYSRTISSASTSGVLRGAVFGFATLEFER